MFLVFILAIVELNLLAGKFHRCYTEHISLSPKQNVNLILNKWDCLNYGGEWIKPNLNFDTLNDSF